MTPEEVVTIETPPGTAYHEVRVWDGSAWRHVAWAQPMGHAEHLRDVLVSCITFAQTEARKGYEPIPPRGKCGMRYHHESCDCGGVGGDR